jgi:hypothetical protein
MISKYITDKVTKIDPDSGFDVDHSSRTNGFSDHVWFQLVA